MQGVKAPLELFADMRARRARGNRFQGVKSAHEAKRRAKHVWTCAACTYERLDTPYDKPYTRARPAPCRACGGTAWIHSASKGEAARYAQLRLQAGAGVRIRNLVHPPPELWLTTRSEWNEDTGEEDLRSYTPDYQYEARVDGKAWSTVVEDFKPHPRLTELEKLIHTMVYHQYKIDVLITWYTGKPANRVLHRRWASKLR